MGDCRDAISYFVCWVIAPSGAVVFERSRSRCAAYVLLRSTA